MGVTAHTVERKCWSAQRQTLSSGAGTHGDRGSYYLMWHSVHEIGHTFKFLITKVSETNEIQRQVVSQKEEDKEKKEKKEEKEKSKTKLGAQCTLRLPEE